MARPKTEAERNPLYQAGKCVSLDRGFGESAKILQFDRPRPMFHKTAARGCPARLNPPLQRLEFTARPKNLS